MEAFAQELRNRPRTIPEQVMREILDAHFLKWNFADQVPLHNRVADFYSEPLNLAVEVDGPYHNSPKRWWVAPDGYKERALRKRGFNMIRFQNSDVLEYPEWVIDQIAKILPIFEVPVTANGPFCPLGVIVRLQFAKPSMAEFVLEMEDATVPKLEDIVARVRAHSIGSK